MLTLMLTLACAAGLDESFTLKPVATGGMPKVGYYAPQRLALKAEKPATLMKEPDGLKDALYGVLPMKGPDGAVYHVIVVETDGQPAKLFVDSNGNGDLTDDGAAEWTGKEAKSRDGKPAFTTYNGGATVKLGSAAKPFDAHVAMYRFDKNDPQRAALKDTLLYYRDYVSEGEITLGSKTYKILLSDEATGGDYSGEGVKFLIDVNGNGKFDARGEAYPANAPFNIGGVTYEFKDISKDGSSVKIVKSDKKVDEVLPPPDHSVGKKITSFEGKAMDGKAVKFPGDYKGKVVLLDFWATWCGPCMMEMPNVVENYKQFHDKGFEILGVTLDNKDSDQKIKDTESKSNMTWTQIYDGGGWKAEIAQLYVINSIPAAFLVDGDTGEILATGNSVRGEALKATIEKALDKKKGK